MDSWLATCLAEAEARGLRGVADVLLAFGGPADGVAGSFSSLVDGLRTDGVEDRIVQVIGGEIDRPQAQMFARRFSAVDGILAGLATRSTEALLLRVGLHNRLRELLEQPGPRGMRVRALVDFYYSHGARLHHREPSAPSLGERMALAVWRELAPGMEHALVEGPTSTGPVHINVLRTRGPFRCIDARGRSSSDLVELGAVAWVSGGFFLYSEPDITPPSRRGDPVGLLVTDGVVHQAPVFSRTSLLLVEGRPEIVRLGLEGARLQVGGTEYVVSQMNAPRGAVGGAWNRAFGERTPPVSGPVVTVVGRQITQVSTGSASIPLAGFCVAVEPASPLLVGAHVRFVLPRDIDQGIAGGPALSADGPAPLASEDFAATAPPITFSRDETFDQNLLPRMAAGIDGRGRLCLAAIDGRNFERAPGFTLAETAALMQLLGCRVAMNLDGGSSKRMVVGGRVMDLSSTEIVAAETVPRVRPLHTAILLMRP